MEFIKPSEQFDLKGFYLEITSKCNLRCLHCYNESGILKNEISFELFKRLIDEFDEKPDITFSGGEPLLHPDIWKMLEYAQDKINNDSVLITNATLITDEIAKKLTASGIGVQVSLTISYIGIISTINCYLPIIITCSLVPYCILFFFQQRKKYEQNVELSDKRRYVNYLNSVLTERENAKDIRTFESLGGLVN